MRSSMLLLLALLNGTLMLWAIVLRWLTYLACRPREISFALTCFKNEEISFLSCGRIVSSSSSRCTALRSWYSQSCIWSGVIRYLSDWIFKAGLRISRGFAIVALGAPGGIRTRVFDSLRFLERPKYSRHGSLTGLYVRGLYTTGASLRLQGD